MMALEKTVRLYRTHCGYSLRSFARLLGIDHTTLYRFESGKEIEGRAWVKIVHWFLTAEHQQQPKGNS